MFKNILNKALILLSIILLVSCNDMKKDNMKSVFKERDSIEFKTAKVKENQKRDAIFLDFRLGMTKSEYQTHLKELIKKKKLKYSNDSIIYNLKFKRQVFEDEDEYLSNDKLRSINERKGIATQTKVINLSYRGDLVPKFGSNRLYELTLTFNNTTNLRSEFVLPFVLENLTKKYGCFKNSKLAEFSCLIKENSKGEKEVILKSDGSVINAFRSIALDNPIYKVDKAIEDKFYKSLIEKKEKNISYYLWNLPNSIMISVQGEYGIPGSDSIGNKVLLNEKKVVIKYLSDEYRSNYLDSEKRIINMGNTNSANDF